ncbi:MAG: hypothetical protein CK427_06195 [Leptospira sp.]|nr:MAG: hypothetical protein CK427_06195 [Leptospira sp.]
MIIRKKDILLKEYEIVSDQITYWDNQYWTKQKFFISVEGLFLSGSSFLLNNEMFREDNIELQTLFFSLIAFNIVMCFIWFISCKRTKEYIDLRMKRAKNIEKYIKVAKLYRYHDNKFYLKQCNFSGKLERHIPSVFMVLWFIILFMHFIFPFIKKVCCLLILCAK